MRSTPHARLAAASACALSLLSCDVRDVAFRIGPEACLADLDSDDDGLFDGEECALGTNPADPDTDHDGVTDLGELRGSMTNPLDPTSTIPEDDYLVTLPWHGDHELRTLRFDLRVQTADVFFLVDGTVSMRRTRESLIASVLSVVVPGLVRAIPDVWVGVGSVEDYPVDGYGRDDRIPLDSPFAMVLDMSDPYQDIGYPSVMISLFAGCPAASYYAPGARNVFIGAPNGRQDLLEALEALPCGTGGDEPDAYVAALFLTATGGSLSWPGGSDTSGSWASGSIPERTCPEGRIGYPCFRPDALPVIMLVGDAPFHEGPTLSNRYDAGRLPGAPTYADAVTALDALGAHVISVFTGTELPDAALRRFDFETLARDTGAVDVGGTPLVFDAAADGTVFGETAVDAVDSLVENVAEDVSAETRDAPPNPDGFDARAFVRSIAPIEGYRGDTPGASPGVSYTSKDETTFYGVVPGTRLEFAIDFYNDAREPGPVTEIYRARIVVLANGAAVLAEHDVYVIVPSAR